jgi:hypothetical protein
VPLSARAAPVVAAWVTVVLFAQLNEPSQQVHSIALFVHLASMLTGFGAVLLVDWFGLLWAVRRRTLADVLRTAAGAHVPTWAGFTGLLASGALLAPEPTGMTAIKLLAVLVIGLNGVFAGDLLRRLSTFAGSAPPAGLMARSLLAAAVSQVAWWTAVVIGFLNSQS